MDRFNPAIYNLGHEYRKGHLIIKVGTEETLSHYAEWAWIPEKTLRNLNRIRTARDLRMGRDVRIPMAEEKAADFLAKREEYYRAMEEDFYGNYYVSAVEPLVVAKGMNLWGLVHEKEIPFWLLQKHNPGRLLGAVRPGDTLSLPSIETGIRKWGFTRYGNSREHLAGITRFIMSDQAR
jgi:membrane-bound lytic murein transglycosylase D